MHNAINFSPLAGENRLGLVRQRLPSLREGGVTRSFLTQSHPLQVSLGGKLPSFTILSRQGRGGTRKCA